jgi:hypothetical protein
MALIDLSHTSAYGPNNRGKKGTGTVLGPNNSPLPNAQFGNPTANAATYNSLFDASHASLYGPFNKVGSKGTGISPDLFGNIPAEG